MAEIHPTAIVQTQVPESVKIGAYSIIERGAKLGPGVNIGAHCHVHGNVTLGKNVRLYGHSVLGSDPQDLKFKGEKSHVAIGDGTIIREFVTVNGATGINGETSVGKKCLLMAYVHVAHDCSLGNEVLLANGVQLGGHVTIGDFSVVSGLTGIHQFTTLGAGVFVGGGLRVTRDLPPFSRFMGEPLTWAGLNTHGLRKAGLELMEPRLKSFFRKWKKGDSKEWEALLSSEARGALPVFHHFFSRSKRPLLH